ncbi:MAG: N-acetylmuramoyl-L-alanine amidase [Alphaproteobacteria bacterium]
MTIDTTLEAAWYPSPNFEPRRDGMKPYILLLHYTGMETAERALYWLCTEESKVSCHYMIDEEGRITQTVRENMRAWHAGRACWNGETDINSASIGIEIHNPGPGWGYPDFPEAQMCAVESLSRDIISRYDIVSHHVLGHSDVAPMRKADPGEKFDWGRLARAGIGHWVPPAPAAGDDGLGLGDTGDEVKRLQCLLASYGYHVPESGVFDEETEKVVTAWQRHFRPALVNGRADCSTFDTLSRLIKALPQE